MRQHDIFTFLRVFYTYCLRNARALPNRELKHARFCDADGNRKRTFRVPGGGKILSNINVVV